MNELHAHPDRPEPSHRAVLSMGSASQTLTQPDVSNEAPLDGLTSSEPAPRRIAPAPVEGYLGHYEILRPLGSGGMGTVVLARDTKLGRLVAIKLLHSGGEAASRLLAEARATARARHENIVVIYEIGTFDGRPYMVLEYVEGRTLRQVISTAQSNGIRALSRGMALEIMVPVIRALEAAHASGIVHRDLKPENIMLLDTGQVKVLDFGIAISVDSNAPTTRAGTQPYMSPEQWSDVEPDVRSDLWTVGIILFELLAGAHPLAPLTASRVATIGDPEIPMPNLRDVRPDLGGLSDVVERCLRKKRDERFGSAEELLTALEPFLARSKFVPKGKIDCPFAGLAAFQESDGDRFFGRQRDVMALLGLLDRQSLVTVAGASGAGKSSFVRAGLIPALKHGGDDWEILVVRPGRAPLTTLREALDLGENDIDLRANPNEFGTRLRARCREQGGARRVFVFVDQLEELYTLAQDADERAAFLACLLGAADDASSPLRVVLCIRSDFLDRVVDDRHFMKHVAAGLFFLPPVDAAGQREALTLPVDAAGYRFESDAMIDIILDDLARTKNPLPLLQFAATKLWEARDTERKLLTLAAYENMGGVGGALATHADTVVAALPPAAQGLCRAILLRLVTPERTRAVVYLRELSALGKDAGAADAIVQHLAAARLLAVENDVEQGSAKVEIVHESLIARWPTLGRWLDESAGDAHFLARLRAAASQWEAGGEPVGMLWRDGAAEEARRFHERYRRDADETRRALVGTLEQRYLDAVITFSERSRRMRNRWFAAAFGAVCVIAMVVFFLALDARGQARRADEEAARVRERNGELAFQALRGRNATRVLAARRNQDDPTLALAILREIEAPDIPKDWAELVSAALSTGVASDVWRSDPNRCGYAAVTSPDGARIAVAMDDHTTRILGDDLAERVSLRGHEKLVWSVAWSPDSKRIVTASFDNTARIWLADGSGEALVLRGHTDALNSAKMSPDGQRVVTTSDDRTARVWSVHDGRELYVMRHDSEVNFADWSPDGERIVTASSDGLARIWSANGKSEQRVLRGHTDMVVAASFHPDGTRIVTAGRDRTVRVWDAQSGAELFALKGHEEKVMSVAWSPDGKRIATASKDKTARIWHADGRGAPIVLRGHGHWVYTATWTPDSRQVITTSLDGTQRRFRLDDVVAPVLLRGHEDAIRALAFSPDGQRIVTGSMDATARIWNVDATGEATVLRGHSDAVTLLRFSPDGARLAVLSGKTGRIWTLDGAAESVVFRGTGAVFQTLDWSPDGERLVTASADGTLTLWSKDGAELSTVKKQTSSEYKWIHCSFDSSGKRVLVTDTLDKTVYLWNVDERDGLVSLGQLDGFVRAAKWRPDSAQIFAISTSGSALVWDARGAVAPMEVRAVKPIYNGMWSPDGSRIVFALADGTLLPYRDGAFGQPIGAGVPQEGIGNASFSPDGRRILTSTPYGKVRVRNADGTGAPFVLEGIALASGYALFSPGGDRIAVTYEDKFAWIWPELQPFSGADDVRLWAVTSYCIPPAIRVDVLGVTEAQAQSDEQACQRRIAETR